MNKKNTKSFNSQVYSIACNRLKLKRREKIIFYRLLGFLIRNDKPFPYTVPKLSEITGYEDRSIYRALNELERLRLIERIGYTKNVKFTKGIILIKICALVTKRPLYKQVKNKSFPTFCQKSQPTSDKKSYQNTSLSLKHTNMADFLKSLTPEERQERAWYENNPRFPVKDCHKYLFPDLEPC